MTLAACSDARRADAGRTGQRHHDHHVVDHHDVPPTTTTTAPPPTIVAPPPGLGIGARGPEVQALEERLAAMKYDVGKVDGYFDSQ